MVDPITKMLGKNKSGKPFLKEKTYKLGKGNYLKGYEIMVIKW